MSLHSFFFFRGQTVGPIAYGFGILHVEDADVADLRLHHHGARLCLRTAVAAKAAGGRGRAAGRSALGSRRSRGAKDVAQSARVCLTESWGRGNSEAIASRSLFVVDL